MARRVNGKSSVNSRVDNQQSIDHNFMFYALSTLNSLRDTDTTDIYTMVSLAMANWYAVTRRRAVLVGPESALQRM